MNVLCSSSSFCEKLFMHIYSSETNLTQVTPVKKLDILLGWFSLKQ